MNAVRLIYDSAVILFTSNMIACCFGNYMLIVRAIHQLSGTH